MRKLLVLLSVVLLFALCQSQKLRDSSKIRVRPHVRDCIFGYKKVNGTKVCKTMEEFFKHPRNDTNCTKNKTLKCFKFHNATACLCVKKHVRPPKPINVTTCPVGFIYRCKRDRFTHKQECRCRRMGPVPVNFTTGPGLKECPEGKELYCPKKRPCICRRIKKKPEPVEPVPVPEPAVGLF
jgi:hypothetical protein